MAWLPLVQAEQVAITRPRIWKYWARFTTQVLLMNFRYEVDGIPCSPLENSERQNSSCADDEPWVEPYASPTSFGGSAARSSPASAMAFSVANVESRATRPIERTFLR